MVQKSGYIFFKKPALKFYFFVQRLMYSQISKREYRNLIDQNKILERDGWGIKVLETSDHKIFKIFRLKRLISSAYFVPHALRFKWNAYFLKKMGVESVVVDEIVYCREEQRHVLSYEKVPGQPIKSILERNQDDKDLLKKLIAFVAMLHDKGIYFRSLHFGNIIVKPNGDFVLIDITDMRFSPFKLSIKQRIRNWKHLIKYDFEKSTVENYGWDAFFEDYAHFAMLSTKQAKVFKKGIIRSL